MANDDKQFWRDIEATTRLSTRSLAMAMIRDLILVLAYEEMAGELADQFNIEKIEQRRRDLYYEVEARGYPMVERHLIKFINLDEFSAPCDG